MRFDTTRKANQKHLITRWPPCRRCGTETCSCTDEELDNGGPA
jgi:hypothetical protein